MCLAYNFLHTYFLILSVYYYLIVFYSKTLLSNVERRKRDDASRRVAIERKLTSGCPTDFHRNFGNSR